jgi:protein-tyrosine phosphatase
VAVFSDRVIPWEGFYNARDLGGLPTVTGARTRYGRLIRSADTRFVTADRHPVLADTRR